MALATGWAGAGHTAPQSPPASWLHPAKLGISEGSFSRCLPWLYTLLGSPSPLPLLLLWLPSGSSLELAGVTSMGVWVSCVPGTAVVPKFQMKKWRLAEGCRW